MHVLLSGQALRESTERHFASLQSQMQSQYAALQSQMISVQSQLAQLTEREHVASENKQRAVQDSAEKVSGGGEDGGALA